MCLYIYIVSLNTRLLKLRLYLHLMLQFLACPAFTRIGFSKMHWQWSGNVCSPTATQVKKDLNCWIVKQQANMIHMLVLWQNYCSSIVILWLDTKNQLLASQALLAEILCRIASSDFIVVNRQKRSFVTCVYLLWLQASYQRQSWDACRYVYALQYQRVY